jgi:flagellar biosynthesis protein FlhG
MMDTSDEARAEAPREEVPDEAPQGLDGDPREEAREATRDDDERDGTRDEPIALDEAQEPGGPCIWAVGGGKGGVGKSMVTSSLAVALAGRGQRVVVVDADLGGANIDTIFGVAKPPHTLSEFLAGEVSRLSDVLSPTSVANLRIVSGSNALLDMANPRHSQKQKFMRHLRFLPVDHVLLDLGAGSNYNVLDFFLVARRGIVLVVPEPTSIENAYHFLKAAFFRSLRAVARNATVHAALSRVIDERIKRRVRSPLDLIGAVMEVDPEAGRILRQRARSFAPMLIVNDVRNDEQRALGNKIAQVCREHMGTEIESLGWLEHDQHVADAVHHRKPVLQLYPTCDFAKGVRRIVDRVLRGSPEAVERTPVGLPPLDVSCPGAYLRACRQALGLELGQLMERTQVRCLEALEEERLEALPPGPYVRNFVLAYARELGIKEADLLAASYAKRFRRSLQDGPPAAAR